LYISARFRASLLPREAWQALLASGAVRWFEKGEILMRQGEPGRDALAGCSASGGSWQSVFMLIEHRGSAPQIHPSAYVAPTAVLCGAVQVGRDARVLFGAVLTAEDGEVRLGARSVVMENALVRGRARHPSVIGDDVIVGPHAHLNGVQVGNGCFLGTGAALFPGSVLGAGAEVRIHGVVQVNTVLPPGATVPIGWVAVGDPARIYPPDQHEQIWSVQESLDFPATVYGVARDTPATERMSRQATWFAAHLDDRQIE
jgi:carbonic anhydrase/acetyltransferase-like protein (isoleucine patch superfamily)